MEGESFEDEEIARFMNEHYVCIKVDREERPDVDAIYMSAVQALTRSGGWPMSVWLTPAREPFFGGTYFPPRDGARGAQPRLPHDPARAGADLRQGRRARDARREVARRGRAQGHGRAGDAGGRREPGPRGRSSARRSTTSSAPSTRVEGGVRRAPKFPSNIPVRLLLRTHRRTGDAEALHMATLTLEKMAGGGMYDQLGGGFHRYSTDARWLVPHFEKMLYDNALLAVAYAEARAGDGRAPTSRASRARRSTTCCAR